MKTTEHKIFLNGEKAFKAVQALLVTAIFLILGPAYAGAAGAKDSGGDAGLEPLRLGVMTDSVTAYVGEIGNAEGIFEKYGLKVEVATFAAGINTIDAVTLGQMDIGFGADFAVLNRLGGSPSSPLRIFVGLGEGSLNSWQLYAQGASIQKPADLRGKHIVTRLGTVEEYWIAKTLTSNGVSLNEVTYLPVEATMEGVALIQNGSAVAMWANARPAESLKKIEGVHPIADLSAAGAPTVSIAVATEQYLREHQSAVVKYLKATQEIYDFIDKNPQRAAEIVQKAIGTPVEQTLINIKNNVSYIKLDQGVFDALASLYKWTEENGVIKNPYNLQGYINVEALKAAYPGRAEFK